MGGFLYVWALIALMVFSLRVINITPMNTPMKLTTDIAAMSVNTIIVAWYSLSDILDDNDTLLCITAV